MDETQDAEPGSTEPQQAAPEVAPAGELNVPAADSSASATTSSPASAPVASSVGGLPSSPAEAGNVDAGTVPDGAATPAIAYPSASQSSAEVAPLGEVSANPSSQPSADSSVSISAGDAGEPLAEEPEDSGMPSQSNSIVDPVPAVEAGNAPGPVDSAETATSPEDALTAVVAVTAAAFSVDLSDRFETRAYPDGTIMKTVGALPETSPVSYPAPTAPAADTPHGLLNAIEEYFTTALRSSRTDGHKLIAQLRNKLTQD